MAAQKTNCSNSFPEHHEILKKLSEFQNKPVTTIVHEFVEACMPMAEEMVKAYQDLKLGKSLAEVERKLFAEGLRIASENMKD